MSSADFRCAPDDAPSEILCAHSFLYVDTITARCVHCGEIKIDREAA